MADKDPEQQKPESGGAAFPRQAALIDNRISAGQRGMSLRDYFMAHAPAEPQPWFTPQICDAPKAVSALPNDLTEEEAAEYQGWIDVLDTADIKSPRVRAYAEAIDAYTVSYAAWSKEYSKQLLVQWPYAWADEQLKVRAK